jgi:hypothetical protein
MKQMFNMKRGLEASTTEVANLLKKFNSVVSPQVLIEVAAEKRLINADTYEEQPLAEMDYAQQRALLEAYEKKLEERLARQVQLYGEQTLTMFTCPNGSATQMLEAPESCLPESFDQNQILYQRLQKIFELFAFAKEKGEKLSLVLLVGDVDFATYYQPALEYKGIKLDEKAYTERAARYRDSIADFLALNSNGLFEVVTYGSAVVPIQSITERKFLASNTLKVVSLALNTNMISEREYGPGSAYDPRDINEEEFYTSRRFANPNRFDPRVFSDLPDDILRKVSKEKFHDYAMQGQLLDYLGGVVLMDEFPPALKARMFGRGLSFIFPWIRKEDAYRNPDYNDLKGVKRKFKFPTGNY